MQRQGLGSRHLPGEALSFPRAGGGSRVGGGLSREQAGGSCKGIDRGILKDILMLVPSGCSHNARFSYPGSSWSVGPGPYYNWVLIQGLSFSVCEMREADREL